MTRWKKPAAAALLLTLAACAAWLWLVYDAATMRQALWRGWTFGVGHFTINDNWIQHAFTYQDKMPHWLGYGAVVLLAASISARLRASEGRISGLPPASASPA